MDLLLFGRGFQAPLMLLEVATHFRPSSVGSAGQRVGLVPEWRLDGPKRVPATQALPSSLLCIKSHTREGNKTILFLLRRETALALLSEISHPRREKVSFSLTQHFPISATPASAHRYSARRDTNI